jgi:hypothetical protein
MRWAELRMCRFWAGGISSFPFSRAREYRLLRRLDESWRIELTQKTKEMDFCVVFCASEIVGSILAVNRLVCGLIWKESVNAVPNIVGFLRALWFPRTGKVDRVG